MDAFVTRPPVSEQDERTDLGRASAASASRSLEIDHVIPKAEGGDDDIENLVTACWDCNRGKGASLLDDRPAAVPSLVERTELLREREEQLRAYHAALEEVSSRQDAQFDRVWNAWFDIWGKDTLPHQQTPGKAALRRYIDSLGEREVMLALEPVEQKFRWPSNNAVRYFFGILKWKLGKVEGRVQTCQYCGKDVLLEPQDDISVRWSHVSCVEAATR